MKGLAWGCETVKGMMRGSCEDRVGVSQRECDWGSFGTRNTHDGIGEIKPDHNIVIRRRHLARQEQAMKTDVSINRRDHFV